MRVHKTGFDGVDLQEDNILVDGVSIYWINGILDKKQGECSISIHNADTALMLGEYIK
jgi:hypothetical protein